MGRSPYRVPNIIDNRTLKRQPSLIQKNVVRHQKSDFSTPSELAARRLAEQQAKQNRKRGPGGGRRRKLFAYQEVLLTLVYLRHNVSHAVAGQMFSVSADITPIEP